MAIKSIVIKRSICHGKLLYFKFVLPFNKCKLKALLIPGGILWSAFI